MVSVPTVTVNLEASVGDALLKAFPGTPFHIVRKAPHFFLGEGRKQRQHQFAVLGQAINVFLFKLNRNAQFL